MRLQLLHCTGAEGVAGGQQHLEVVLAQPVADFGQISGLAHAIHAAEHNHVGLALLAAQLNVVEHIHLALVEDAGQRLLKRVLDKPPNAWWVAR
jgi:hypothetical protein